MTVLDEALEREQDKAPMTDSTAPPPREGMELRSLKRELRVLASCLQSRFKEIRYDSFSCPFTADEEITLYSANAE